MKIIGLLIQYIMLDSHATCINKVYFSGIINTSHVECNLATQFILIIWIKIVNNK
jgi:hypothetical protein